jgi:hypothetical protein
MPLRDHFSPPVDNLVSWESFYAGWPAVIVQHFRKVFPPGYVAGPRIHFGSQVDGDYDEYVVRAYDAREDRRLVAAVEFVSPRNKDRADARAALVSKCHALLQRAVCVVIVDPVTTHHFNLYAELMTFLGQADPTLGDPPPPVYAASCRWTVKDKRPWLEAWSNRLVVGQPLPTLPLWLSPTRVVPLDLERGYEETCHDLWLT